MIEVPLLFETEMEGLFDATVASSPPRRCGGRGRRARGHALVEEREARQLTQDEKARRADHVVLNDGTIAELEAKLSALIESLTGARNPPGPTRYNSRPPMAASSTQRRPARSRVSSRAADRRRRVRLRRAIALGAVALVGLGAVYLLVSGSVDKAIEELTLPLRHEDIIRQQAAEKGVDASLIAAVIYAESRFRDQTSSAGARGLMQITPATAKDIERRSGGTTFTVNDLSDPQINIPYGTFHLRDLLDRYYGNEVAALAAYNAGPGDGRRLGRRGDVASTTSASPRPGPTSRTCSRSRTPTATSTRKELGY